ncbi:PREDICTED: uncharacterized protein LOC109584405 [Amphimedon queenslandica]|uniref:Uncharacterized protein n=1 Tax=Amphimedon queenslandica TaxID=400682 RepID=A0AAN0JFZ3_AMPQE|nr:PREDICTED: uncharacterized protein LOC109584405 [Amphimedon queenslandica]|eukprot:XP_019855707.1 PREDICTED: uncharacterized protein LOC109584405 [Amphimedon queenslandica]
MEDRCFDSDLKIMDSRRGKTVRVSCLLLVDYNVLVGLLNKTIHILDVETLCHVSQLSNLEDEPGDLALSKNEPMIVWSLLLNGTVLGFDPETRERVAKITVPNMLQHTFCTCFTVYRDFLWVGTNRGTISILSTEYSEQQLRNEIAFTESGKTVEVKYLAVSSEDEIWCSVHAIPRAKNSTFIAVYNPRNNTKIYSYSNFEGNDSLIYTAC